MKLAAYTLSVSVGYAVLAVVNPAAAQVFVIPFVALLLAPVLWKEIV